MLRAIGFRSTPHEIYYSIIELQDDGIMKIISVDHISIPKSLMVPEQLKHVRSNILDIINEYKISAAGIRITEPNSKTKSIARLSYEGVIQELFASSCLDSYYIGSISTITKRINIPRDDFKKYISNLIVYDRIDNFHDFKKEEKEAILTTIGAFYAD